MKKIRTFITVITIIGIGLYYYFYIYNNSTPLPAQPLNITYTYKADKVITNQVYTAYFNYTLHEPLYVAYKLYHGGGDCKRTHMHFKTGDLENSATVDDYKHSLFDEGHLCPAEDEAFDCDREELTFRFYNCLPQTPKLNRGIWKVWETQVRNESQDDSLLVLCGGIFGDRRIGDAAVPDYCWKLVYSLSNRKVMHCILFPNDDSDDAEDVPVDSLLRRVGYPLYLPGK
ncbi:MAG TPA: DNA/RNA non-specific endonuclease [Chitinophagaceae bacterium]|nr:DNA/RNA non-specific endonuclease [Chitinophagaceae bacterium]